MIIEVESKGWGILKDSEGNTYYCDADGYGMVESAVTGELFKISKRDENGYPVEIKRR